MESIFLQVLIQTLLPQFPEAVGKKRAASGAKCSLGGPITKDCVRLGNGNQKALLITPPSARSAAPVVADARGLAT